MRLSIIGFCFIVCLSACTRPEKRSEPAFATLTYRIEGMVCTSCEQGISATYARATGARVITISHEKGLMVVRVDTLHPRLKDAEDKIRRMGYTIASRNVSTAADSTGSAM
jgi:cation transport ATPase